MTWEILKISTTKAEPSKIHLVPRRQIEVPDRNEMREIQIEKMRQLKEILANNRQLKGRFERVTNYAKQIRSSEYHVTNACNIRCKGCWFFEFEHDKETREVKDLNVLEAFLINEREHRKVNSALVIGGEPALFLDRLAVFEANMQNLTISTNGLIKIPYEKFENTAIALTLFGGGPIDDQLRAIKPGGARFTGLFDRALENYKNDPRAVFIYAVTEDGIEHIEDTVKKIHANGNLVNFNYYSKYDQKSPAHQPVLDALLAELLRVKKRYPKTILSHEYYIKTMVTGRSHWDAFAYENCPSISVDHPAHSRRMVNGNPYLPRFNTWAADMKTVKFCCTSGHCAGCRDSQAVFSWLLVSMKHFLCDAKMLEVWIELSESYWRQFIWSPYSTIVNA